MNMIVILYVIYTQEDSQIFNMLIVEPNMNMTLVQVYISECTVKQAETVFVTCDLIDLIICQSVTNRGDLNCSIG